MSKPTKRRRVTTGGRAAQPTTGRVVTVGGERVGRKFVVEGELVFGRSSGCDVVIDHSEVSRRHTIVRQEAGGRGYSIEDLGSRNGTTLNGEPVKQPMPLSFGDKFRVGPREVFLFSAHDPVEEELIRRQRLETLGRLTAGVAHDLNNMLGAVAASVSFLRQLPAEAMAGEAGSECLDDIDTASNRAADLAARLLTFARSSGARSRLDLAEICFESVKLAKRTFERTIRIETKLEPPLYIEGDDTQMHQIVMNLLVNARDSIESQGSITVRAARQGDMVVMSVADDGCGMDNETRKHIFEPFYTTKQPGTGFGLGLATLADIVSGHGGKVDVKSKVGKGSTFSIRLPAAIPATRQMQSTSSGISVGRRRGDGLQVLIVDDEAVMLRSLERVFSRMGFKTVGVEDAEQALAYVHSAPRPPDVVVLDLDLPGMSGEDALGYLRKQVHRLPVVCISGHRDGARETEVRARGATAFLGKPFEPEELFAEVFRAIDSQGGPDDMDATTAS